MSDEIIEAIAQKADLIETISLGNPVTREGLDRIRELAYQIRKMCDAEIGK